MTAVVDRDPVPGDGIFDEMTVRRVAVHPVEHRYHEVAIFDPDDHVHDHACGHRNASRSRNERGAIGSNQASLTSQNAQRWIAVTVDNALEAMTFMNGSARRIYYLEKELAKRKTNFRVMYGSIILNFILIGFIIGGLLP